MANYKYPAVVYKQRDSAEHLFCVCSARVGEVQAWARVDRLTPTNKAGVQRQKKDARVDAIADFLKVDPRNTIPTSIIIAIPREAVEFSGLNVDSIETQAIATELMINTNDSFPQPGLIIDGQHRSFGIAQFDPAMLVNLVIIIGPSDDEIAFQFVVINNKVSKVSAEHIKALKLGYSDANLDSRLKRSARIRSTGQPAYLDQIDTQDDSPFKGRLKWPRTEVEAARAIPINAFEIALNFVANQRIDQTASSDPNPDFVVRFFLEVWKAISTKWNSVWEDPACKLTTKVGVVCMTEYIVDTIISWSMAPGRKIDLTDLNEVNELTYAALDQQEAAFWTSEWNAASLDTSSGRQTIIDALKDVQRNKARGFPWDQKIRLVNGKAVD